MAQALHDTIDVGIGVDLYPPQPAQNQASHGVSTSFVDGSGPIFSMYLEMATEEDKKMVENWKADADGILIFTGLFSASVASLISMAIQDIQQNPQDVSNFYLANTYQATINPNIISSLPTSPPPFSPPKYAVWVNALWFLSLVISLTCALFATFLQQWARRYLKLTQSRYSLHKRSRIRAFFAEGVEKFHLPLVVETLPILLHISLFLFFAGLVVFLSNVNLTIFKLVLSWVAICVALYGCITLFPMFRHDSPYYTSLSSSVWPIVFWTVSFVSGVGGCLLYWMSSCLRGAEWYWEFTDLYYPMPWQGMQKTVEETALKSPSEIDTRAFLWTFYSLDEDDELERFFAGLPGFRSSQVVDDPLPDLPIEEHRIFSTALTGLLDRTLSSDLLPESIKNRRAMICAKATDPEHIPDAFDVLEKIMAFRCSGPLAAGVVEILKGWRNDRNEYTASSAQVMIFKIVLTMQPRDHYWRILVSNELGVSETDLQDYATHGDSLLLAILIHFLFQQYSQIENRAWRAIAFSYLLEAASKFDVQDTSPELQHKFCTLWNQIVRKGQNNHYQDIAEFILKPIRSVYIALHQDTDSAPTRFSASTEDLSDTLTDPFSYPVCNAPDHHPDSTPHIHDDPASTVSARVVLPDMGAPISSFLANRYTTPTSARAPLRAEDSTGALPVQTTIENSLTSPDPVIPVTTLTIHGSVDAPSRMESLSTPEPSASPLHALTSPPDVVAVGHAAASRTASSAPILDDILSTGLLLPSASAVAEPDNAFSSTESHSLMLVSASRRRSCPGLSSESNINAPAEREGAKSAVRMEEDTIHPSSAMRDDISPTPNQRSSSALYDIV